MEATAVTKIIAPLVLGMMMLGMGMSLVTADFKRVLVYPKAVAIGTFGQMILLPLMAFLLVSMMPVSPEIAAGVMILAACPGGPGSNLVAMLCKGDAALSVSLTVVSSLLAGFSIPIITHLTLGAFLNQDVELDVFKLFDMGIKVCLITLVPVGLGMLVRKKNSTFADRAQKPVKIASVAFLILLVIGIAVKERENLLSLLQQAGTVGLALCVLTMTLGYSIARLFRLDMRQSRSIMIEVGIQNAALAFLITTVMLDNTAMAIPAAVYSPVMLTISGFLIAYFNFSARDVVATEY